MKAGSSSSPSKKTTPLLILGGTQEARQVAERAAEDDRFSTTYSLAGLTREPRTVEGTLLRRGGFDGPDGFRDYLVSTGTRVVVDATHPYAERMTRTALKVTRELGLAHVVLQRPGWTRVPKDNWHSVSSIDELSRVVPKGSTVFLATGRNHAERLASCLPGRRLLCRVVDLPDHPFPAANGRWIVGRPPFSVSDETELFRDERIDWIVTRNSGSPLAESKLEAAKRLGLPVAMLRRPELPDCTVVDSVDACMMWLSTMHRDQGTSDIL